MKLLPVKTALKINQLEEDASNLVPQVSKGLVFSASYDSLILVAEMAKVIGIEQPDVFLGTAVGALICLFVPIREYAALDNMVRAYRDYYRGMSMTKHLWNTIRRETLPRIIKRLYTVRFHEEMIRARKIVKVGLLNMTTSAVEYFDIATLSYAETLLVIQGAMQPPCLDPVRIQGHYYVDAAVFEQNHVLHVMDLGVTEIDVLMPRTRKPTISPPWSPSHSFATRERVFCLMRDFKPDFQEYTINTISRARKISSRIHYLDDAIKHP